MTSNIKEKEIEMGMVHYGIVFSFIHTVVLLTVSFFVLLAARKVDSQSLKTFGYVIAILLWVAAALALGKGIAARNPMMFHKMRMMCNCAKSGKPMGSCAETPQQAPTK